MSSVEIERATVSFDRSVANDSTGPAGSWRVSMNVERSAMTAATCWPVTNVIRSSQCEPMSPTARSAPPRSGLEPPVPIGVVEQPVLEVAAGDQPDLAKGTARDELVGVLVERVVADVEVRRVHEPGVGCSDDKTGGVLRRHRQGLLADDVLAGTQDGERLLDVDVVGRGDVDDVDGVVREEVIE